MGSPELLEGAAESDTGRSAVDHQWAQSLACDGGGSSGGRWTKPEEPPEEFIDPISQEIMLDPVLLVETGQSYERNTIEAWFARCTEMGRPCTDPLTRKVLRHTTTVSNFSLKSLVSTWAERHRIDDLSSFSKEVARQRTLARNPNSPVGLCGVAMTDVTSAATTTVAELAGMRAAGGSPPAGAGTRSSGSGSNICGSGSVVYPDLGQGRAPPAPTAPQQQQQRQPVWQQQPAVASEANVTQALVDPMVTVGRPALYPSAQQPVPPVNKREASAAALSALRAAASQRGGGSEGAAAYHAWSLMQLAADAEGRDLLWEGNAIPLAIFVLGQPPQQQQKEGKAEAAGLEAAKPALCGMLQRMGARDSDVAASIAQCGGLQVLVSQLTADQWELRVATCRALYFLGWQGPDIRASILEALALHAAACRLPSRPLLAFWRFWEQQPQAEAAPANPGGIIISSLASGREVEWEPLALLLHMLAEGCSGAGAATGSSAQQQLELLDVSASGVPAVLAHGVAASEAPTVRFAAVAATKTLAMLPSNLPPLLEAALREGERARASLTAGGNGSSSSIAGNVCGLLWELCFSPSRGGSLPGVVMAVQRYADQLLDALEAALAPGQKPAAEGKWLAAGLLACLTYEAPQHSDVGAAVAADGMRALLAQQAATGVLQALVELMCASPARASPQTATVAALAVANMAAFRGSAKSPAVSPRTSLLHGSGGSGRLSSGGGSGNYAAAAQTFGKGDSSVGRLAAKLSAAMLNRQSPTPGLVSSLGSQASPPPTPPHQVQPTDPRSALLHHGAVQRLIRLLTDASSAARAADAATMLPPGGTAITPDGRASAVASAASAAAAGGLQRGLLAAALQALNNLCVDKAAAAQLRACARGQLEMQLDLKEALNTAMADPQLQPATRELARRMLHTESGAPGQRHSLACSCPAPPLRAAVYPNP